MKNGFICGFNVVADRCMSELDLQFKAPGENRFKNQGP